MKKDRFLGGLREDLRWRVELKKPKSYEHALEVAKNKEWKLKRMSQLGVESIPRRPEFQHVDPLQGRTLPEVHHVPVVPVTPQIVPAVVNATTVLDDGLRQEMRQVVDLFKDLSLNLLNDAKNGRGRERNENHAKGEGQPRNGGGQGARRNWKYPPTCYNCGELGHISPQCDKPPRMGGTCIHYPHSCQTGPMILVLTLRMKQVLVV